MNYKWPTIELHEPRHPADTDQKTEDPLAELARIVGFDNEETGRLPHRMRRPQRPQSGFDLEAELMRELQINVDDGPQQPAELPAAPTASTRLQAGRTA